MSSRISGLSGSGLFAGPSWVDADQSAGVALGDVRYLSITLSRRTPASKLGSRQGFPAGLFRIELSSMLSGRLSFNCAFSVSSVFQFRSRPNTSIRHLRPFHLQNVAELDPVTADTRLSDVAMPSLLFCQDRDDRFSVKFLLRIVCLRCGQDFFPFKLRDQTGLKSQASVLSWN